jgi:hypothetical protein
MIRSAVPEFVSVTVWLDATVFTTVVKEREVGERLACGVRAAVPVPDSATVQP